MLEKKRDELRREIARRERELEKLEALPDLEALPEGTVAGMAVRLGRANVYTYVGFKTRGKWYVTGKTGPNGVSSNELAEWLTRGGRSLESFLVLAELETIVPGRVIEVETVDLGALLGSALATAEKAASAPRPGAWNPFTDNPYGD